MIKIDENIRFQNVLSYRTSFRYQEMQKELKQFYARIDDLQVQKEGPLFYALYNVPIDEIMDVEFFMPIREMVAEAGELMFHSFYSVENMAATYVFDDYENQMEGAYASLLSFFEQAQLETSTPFFHLIEKDYVKLLLGYGRVSEEE